MISAAQKSGLAVLVSPLFRLAFWRIISAGLTLLAISALVFAFTQIVPGDIVTAILGKHASPDRVAAYRAQLGLDASPVTQYLDWLGGVIHGDLGHSLATREPAWDVLADAVRNTFVLGAIAGLLLVVFSLILGTLAGLNAGRPLDHFITTPTLVMISVPEFVTGTVLIAVVALWAGWLPPVSLVAPGASPLSEPTILVLPVVLLLLVSIGQTTRMIRAGVIESLKSDHVQMAQLSGIQGLVLNRRYVLRNALVPSIQVIVFNLQWLFGGVVVTEVIFSYPGLGATLIEAVGARDIQIVQAACLIVAAVTIVLNLVSDLLAVFLTPKLRTGT